jgi:mannitol 2-dehydrogenase
MRHELIGDYFAKVASEEIAPLVEDLPDMTVINYVKLITERFSNVNILDTVRRVAFDGSSRHTGFVLPIIRDAIDAGTPVSGLLLSQAIWARMCAGWRENGTEIIENDPFWEQLKRKAIAAKDAPLLWLEQDQIYGDLVLNSEVKNEFTAWSESIWSEGIEQTLSRYLKGETL